MQPDNDKQMFQDLVGDDTEVETIRKSDAVKRLVHNLTNQPPAGNHIVARFEAIRDLAIELGELIVYVVPFGDEYRQSLTKLEETVMWARAGIARHQDQIPNDFVESDDAEESRPVA